MSALDAVIAKVRKLRALSQSANVHEASAAAAAADRLIQEHRLAEAQLETEGAPAESCEEAQLHGEGGRKVVWKSMLSGALCRAYGCRAVNGRRPGEWRIDIIGRRSDIETVRYMFAWLSAEIARLTAAHGKGQGRSWRDSFAKGAVIEIGRALHPAQPAIESPASTALVRRDDEADRKLSELYPSLRTARRPRVGDWDALAAGRRAGAGINLNADKRLDGVSRMLGSGS